MSVFCQSPERDYLIEHYSTRFSHTINLKTGHPSFLWSLLSFPLRHSTQSSHITLHMYPSHVTPRLKIADRSFYHSAPVLCVCHTLGCTGEGYTVAVYLAGRSDRSRAYSIRPKCQKAPDPAPRYAWKYASRCSSVIFIAPLSMQWHAPTSPRTST